MGGGALLGQIVNGAAKHFRHIRLTLICALRRLAVKLPETEVQVGKVRELHFVSTSRMELSDVVDISIAGMPIAGAAMCIIIVPFIEPSTTAPREIENCWSPVIS